MFSCPACSGKGSIPLSDGFLVTCVLCVGVGLVGVFELAEFYGEPELTVKKNDRQGGVQAVIDFWSNI